MGRASRQVAQAIAAAGTPPRGVRVIPMGQLPPTNEMFLALEIGLAIAMIVILVLLTAYFQSPRMALVSIGAVPGVFCRDRDHPLRDGHDAEHRVIHGLDHVPGSLGVELGHARDLHERPLEGGEALDEAAIIGASDRLRPILMTACAMTIGMVPMALALEKGSQMQAPLGRAVIGGLVMSTFATLLMVPPIFALLIGGRWQSRRRSTPMTRKPAI